MKKFGEIFMHDFYKCVPLNLNVYERRSIQEKNLKKIELDLTIIA